MNQVDSYSPAARFQQYLWISSLSVTAKSNQNVVEGYYLWECLSSIPQTTPEPVTPAHQLALGNIHICSIQGSFFANDFDHPHRQLMMFCCGAAGA